MKKKQAETSRSIFRNVLYGFSTWILPLGLSFFATPIILKSLGHEDYGIYALVLGFVGYSFNFSFGRAIIKYISEYTASGEYEKIPGIISTAIFINLFVGLLGVAIIVASAGWLVEDVFNIEPESRVKTVNALYLAAIIIFFTTQNQIFSSILHGLQRFDLYSKIFNLGNFLLLAGNVVLAFYGYGLIGLFVWNLVVTIISGFCFAAAARQSLPGIKLPLKPEPGTIKLIVYFSASVIACQILSNFWVLFERGWITARLGAENLAYYVVSMTVAIYIPAFISSLIMVVFPLASQLKNDEPKLLRLYQKSTKIVCGLVVFLTLTVIIESRVFLTLWMGADFAARTTDMLVIHTVSFALLAIMSVSWQMTEGLGYPIYNCLLIFICLSITIFLMTKLTADYAGTGVAFSRMIGIGVIFPSIYFVEKWFFAKVQWLLWLRLFALLVPAAIMTLLVEKYIVESQTLSWLAFVTASGAGGAVYCLMLWMTGFVNDEERALIAHVLKRNKTNETTV